jgi:hypothetical protein
MMFFKKAVIPGLLWLVACSAPAVSVRGDTPTPSGVQIKYEDDVVSVTTYPVTLPYDPRAIPVTGFIHATKVVVVCKDGREVYKQSCSRAAGRTTLVFACGGHYAVAVTNRSPLSYEFIRGQAEHANPHEVIYYDRRGVLVTSCRTNSEQCDWFLDDSSY